MRQYARPVSVPDPSQSDPHEEPPPAAGREFAPAKRAYRRNADGSPVLRRHHSGRSFVRIGGKDYSCGKYGTPEVNAEYRRMIAEFTLTGKVTPRKPQNQRTPEAISINELALAYWRSVKETYGVVPTSTPRWTECVRIRLAIKALVGLYGHNRVIDFGPQRLVVLQKVHIRDGLSLKTVNDRIAVIRRCFKWGVAQGIALRRLPTVILDAPHTPEPTSVMVKRSKPRRCPSRAEHRAGPAGPDRTVHPRQTPFSLPILPLPALLLAFFGHQPCLHCLLSLPRLRNMLGGE